VFELWSASLVQFEELGDEGQLLLRSSEHETTFGVQGYGGFTARRSVKRKLSADYADDTDV